LIRSNLKRGWIEHIKYIGPTKKFADLIINGEAAVGKTCWLLMALRSGLTI
jgi:hypothetical protein